MHRIRADVGVLGRLQLSDLEQIEPQELDRVLADADLVIRAYAAKGWLVAGTCALLYAPGRVAAWSP